MRITAKSKRRVLTALILIALVGMLASMQLQLTACAPQSSAENKPAGEDAQATPDTDQAFTWQANSDCAVCHTVEGDSLSNSVRPQAVAHASQDCGGCHTDEAVLLQAHDGVGYSSKMPKKAKLETVHEQTCIACHGDLSTMAQKTTASTALSDSNGLSVNPHERPEGATHAENPATCTDCHKVHSEDLPNDAMKYCAQCHHRGVFQCGTCHPIDD
jgi:cytochrome c553